VNISEILSNLTNLIDNLSIVTNKIRNEVTMEKLNELHEDNKENHFNKFIKIKQMLDVGKEENKKEFNFLVSKLQESTQKYNSLFKINGMI